MLLPKEQNCFVNVFSCFIGSLNVTLYKKILYTFMPIIIFIIIDLVKSCKYSYKLQLNNVFLYERRK